jgi:hypothetical protein
MVPDNRSPDDPRLSRTDPSDEQSEQGRQPERIGPLAVERHRKDDGRALILYTRVEDPRP